MRLRVLGLVALMFVMVSSATTARSVQALTLPETPPIEAVGVVEHEGRLLLAEVYLSIPPGANEDAIARQSLAAVGARPMTPEDMEVLGFTSIVGVVWGQFSDRQRGNDAVVQYHNPADDPTGDGGLPALLNSHATWNDVRTSSFTFEFGGVTSRPSELLDGFNDVGWDDIGESFLLGVAYTAFTVAEIIESDVVMNTANGSIVWAIDGSDYDVESVMLHENGHVLGLGHSNDDQALMYPAYREVQRELGLDDIAGVTFLYPSGSGNREGDPPSRSDPFRLVAKLGFPDQLSFAFEPGDLNERGDVSFATGSANQSLFVARMGGLTEIARGGEPAPGGGQYGLGILGRMDLDSSGNAAYAFVRDPFGFPWGQNAGVYYYQRATEETDAIVTPYVTLAPNGEMFQGALDAVLNNHGDVAFAGLTETDDGLPESSPLGLGVYLYQPGTGIQAVAIPGSPAPGGGVFDLAAFPSINVQGDIAFEGHRSADPCLTVVDPSTLINCDADIYVKSARTGEISRIAGMGDSVPGGGVLRSAIGPMINSQGYVVFAGDLTPEPGILESIGIFLAAPDGTIVPVVRPGDEMPGGGRVLTTGLQPPQFSINDREEVAFSTILDTHSNAILGSPNDMGVYVWSEGELRLVARTGTVAPGIGTIATLFPPFDFNDQPWPTFSGGLINNQGEVLFQATLTNSDGVLLVGTGAAPDPCFDGFDPEGEDFAEYNGPTFSDEYGFAIAARFNGRLCSKTPTDRYFVEIPPDPVAVDGLFGATLQFDPAQGDVALRFLACDAQGCTQPLTPDERVDSPGLRSILWHNTTGDSQLVAVEITLLSHGKPGVPYSLELFFDIPEPEPPPPPPMCGDEEPSPEAIFFESPGEYQFLGGLICEVLPYNLFITEANQALGTDILLADHNAGDLEVRIYFCGETECSEQAIGESSDGGVTQHAAWTKCTDESGYVVIEVLLTDIEAIATFDLSVTTELNPADCPG